MSSEWRHPTHTEQLGLVAKVRLSRAPLRLRQELLGRKKLDKHEEEAIHFVFDQRQQLVLWSDSLDLPFSMLEEAIRTQQAQQAGAAPPAK